MATSTKLQEALGEVGRHLTQDGLAGGLVEPDRFVVALDDDNTTQAWITALSPEELLSVQVRSARRVPRESWPTVLRDLNARNRDHRLTSVWLLVADWESSTHGVVVVEAALPVTEGHSVRQVVDFVDAVLADGRRFWHLAAA